jgi:hypothetical protein
MIQRLAEITRIHAEVTGAQSDSEVTGLEYAALDV